MSNSSGSAKVVFLDTSVQIDRLHRPMPLREAIEKYLSGFQLRLSSRVALLEYKRRVLREAQYLLDKLAETGSFHLTVDHVTNRLSHPRFERKKQICLNLCLDSFHSKWASSDDDEMTERFRRILRTLILYGQQNFEESVDSVVPGTGCYWATYPLTEKTAYKRYDFGHKKCSRAEGKCNISDFLRSKRQVCISLLGFLENLSVEKMTKELERARDFLHYMLEGNNVDTIASKEPCLSVGDLLIALESQGVPTFLTKNYKESLVLCDFFGQNLIARSDNGFAELPASTKPWPAVPSFPGVKQSPISLPKPPDDPPA